MFALLGFVWLSCVRSLRAIYYDSSVLDTSLSLSGAFDFFFCHFVNFVGTPK